jgi:hypothetical protein
MSCVIQFLDDAEHLQDRPSGGLLFGRRRSADRRRRGTITSSAIERHIDNLHFSNILDILLEIIVWNLGSAHGQYRAKESATELPEPAG